MYGLSWVSNWDICCSKAYRRNKGVYSMWHGPDGGNKCVALACFHVATEARWPIRDGALPLELFPLSYVQESEKFGCQQRNAMNGMGCVSEVRRRRSIWDYIIAARHGKDFVFSSLSYWKPMQLGEAWVYLQVLKMRLAEQFWTFSSQSSFFAESSRGVPDKKGRSVVATE